MDGFWSPQVTAGVIAAAVAIVVVVAKEFVFDRLREGRASSGESRRLYRRYANPIFDSSEALMWRLWEILEGGRGDYLKGTSVKSTYEHYKATSTLYRLAAVLGWLRGLQRELFVVPIEDRKHWKSLSTAIDSLRRSMSEGAHVEQQRLKSLMALWNVAAEPPVKLEALGAALDSCINRHLHSAGATAAHELSPNQQGGLCRDASDLLVRALGAEELPESLLSETVNDAVQLISVRETWIYFDWQAAIGDLMLTEAAAGDRRYEVIGFRGFEAMLSEGTDEERRWLRRLYALLDDLDVSGDNNTDARIDQLKSIYRATGQLVLSLIQADTELRVSDATRRRAKETVMATSGPT
jgi:hypothetical protein